MIADVNRAVSGLLAPLLPPGCEVVFRAPGEPEGDGPALVWFLADIREDEKSAETDWADVRDESGRVVGRRPPVRRFDLNYLVTAEATDPEVAAALLDAVLVAVDPGKRVPAALVGESLAGRPVTLRLGERAYPDVPRRTTLGVVVSAPLVLPVVTELAPPAEDIRLDVATPGRSAPAPAPGSPRREPGRWRRAAIEEEEKSGAVRGKVE